MRLIQSLALVLGWSLAALAQAPADIFHKTVDVDSVNQISFDVYPNDRIEYRSWPGDDMLIETTVQIQNVEQKVLDFYMRQKRYVLMPEVEGDRMQLVSKDKLRRTVKGTEGTATEEVLIVIYLPENFEAGGSGMYTRVD